MRLNSLQQSLNSGDYLPNQRTGYTLQILGIQGNNYVWHEGSSKIKLTCQLIHVYSSSVRMVTDRQMDRRTDATKCIPCLAINLRPWTREGGLEGVGGC